MPALPGYVKLKVSFVRIPISRDPESEKLRKTDLHLLLKQRRRDLAKRSARNRVFKVPLAIGFLSVLLVLLAGGLFAGGMLYARITIELPTLQSLPVLLNPLDGELLNPTQITDRSGETVLLTLENPGIERRYMAVNPEKQDHFSPQLLRAAVATLQPEFWTSPGYSSENWLDPEPATIAERLASELLLWDEPRSTRRALRMRLLAGQLVTTYGRTQVLEWYLNSAWFGHLAVGAESASRLYFEKSSSELSLAESAMLVTAIEAPALNPLDAPTNALEMQRHLLSEMAMSQIISTEEFTQAIHETVHLREKISDPSSLAPVFTASLLENLQNQFFENRLQRGGLVVVSTLDLDLQNQLICTASTQMKRLQGESSAESTPDSESCPSALLLPTQVFQTTNEFNLASAGLILDPQSGEVLAYMDPALSNGELLDLSGYEPGTLLSPFIALSGFARGLSPASLQWDIPSDKLSENNDAHAWQGPVSIRSAVANDYWIPILDVLNQAGVANTWKMSSTLGFNSLLKYNDSTAPLVSSSPVSMLEIASAYGTLANSGVRSGIQNPSTGEIEPKFAMSVDTSSGRSFYESTQPDTSAVLSQPLAYLINHVLSDESARWETLGYPNVLELGQPIAAKTGKAADGKQVWTVGYTPQRLVLIWMGDTRTGDEGSQLNALMAAGVWHAIMRETVKEISKPGWSTPEGIVQLEVCVPSGMLPSADCPSTLQEVFLSGNEPTLRDTLYQKIEVNRETGLRATVFTDPAMIEEKLFINVPAKARQWALDSGLAVVPTGFDAIPSVPADPDLHISSPVIFSQVSGVVTIKGMLNTKDLAAWSLQVGEGINPSSWLMVGEGSSAVKTENKLASWDTTGLEGLFAIKLTAINEEQSAQSTVIQVTVDNTPPLVKIVYPEEGQSVESIGEFVTLQATVEDNVALDRLEWMLDDKVVSTVTEPPWIYLLPAKSGKHTLQVTAYDKAGNDTVSEKIDFVIK